MCVCVCVCVCVCACTRYVVEWNGSQVGLGRHMAALTSPNDSSSTVKVSSNGSGLFSRIYFKLL